MTGRRVEKLEAEMAIDELLRRFRSEPDRIAGYCLECRNYGRSWLCPPFADYDPAERLRSYRRIRIVAYKVHTGPDDHSAAEVLRPVRAEMEERLRASGTDWLGFAGECRLCAECARLKGESCRHPAMVRPSLEAWGIDVVRLTEEMLQLPLLWSSRPDELPAYLTLVGAQLLH